jgi:hypothetical protein
MSLLLLCYISLLSTGKDRRYRPTGVIMPARIYHVEVVAEVVPLAKRSEEPTPAGIFLQFFPHRSYICERIPRDVPAGE